MELVISVMSSVMSPPELIIYYKQTIMSTLFIMRLIVRRVRKPRPCFGAKANEWTAAAHAAAGGQVEDIALASCGVRRSQV